MRKMLPWLVSLLLAITLIAIVVIYVGSTMFGDKEAADPVQAVSKNVEKEQNQEPISADERIKVTSELTDIIANLSGMDYMVKISFVFQLDSESSKEEFDKIKEISIKPIISRSLKEMSPEDMNSTVGEDQLTSKLINEINKILTDGKLVNVDVKESIITTI